MTSRGSKSVMQRLALPPKNERFGQIRDLSRLTITDTVGEECRHNP